MPRDTIIYFQGDRIKLSKISAVCRYFVNGYTRTPYVLFLIVDGERIHYYFEFESDREAALDKLLNKLQWSKANDL